MGETDPGTRRWLSPDWLLLIAVAVALAGGVAFWFTGRHGTADLFWAAGTVLAIVPAMWWVIQTLRAGRAGVDVIAVLALGGSLAVGEYLAGALIALMLATGRTLESYAEGRASRDLRALLAHAPRVARRRRPDGTLEVVPLDGIRVGDRLLVGPGEVVPVDGDCEDAAVLDESVVTGESLLVDRHAGDRVASGVVNAGPAFGLRATAVAAESTYAGIVRLAEQATAERAPMVRLADRYATAFLPATLALAGLAWLISGDPVRAVAVLVVATPCPLLLATPIAIVSGLSRAARRGVVIRDGVALETLGRARTLLVDKTGTLTVGRPRVIDMVVAPGADRDATLRLAASVEQVSPHVLAGAIVREARSRGLVLTTPTGLAELPGQGVTGTVDGHRVRVGRSPGEDPDGTVAPSPVERPGAAPLWAGTAVNRAELEGSGLVWVGIDGAPVGVFLVHDPLRADAPRTVRRLRDAGFTRLVMLTGDRPQAAHEVARHLGLDDAVARCTPASKVERVGQESSRAVTVMVGDGVNDAPALATANVGVAMGAYGSTASAEAADAVLTVDRLDRLADSVVIARRARRIAAQSAGVGMGLSLAAMGFAAAGWLPPAAGALLQEGIDVLVILNALRVLGGRAFGPPLAPGTHAMLEHFAAEHEGLRDALTDLRATADLIAASPDCPDSRAALEKTRQRLVEEILPHEHAEERRLYPALAEPLGGDEATATMSRTHVEIDRLAERIASHLRLADGPTLRREQVPDLLASLYGLDAVLRLHFSQEEEHFFSLAPPPAHSATDGAGTGRTV